MDVQAVARRLRGRGDSERLAHARAQRGLGGHAGGRNDRSEVHLGVQLNATALVLPTYQLWRYWGDLGHACLFGSFALLKPLANFLNPPAALVVGVRTCWRVSR